MCREKKTNYAKLEIKVISTYENKYCLKVALYIENMFISNPSKCFVFKMLVDRSEMLYHTPKCKI